MLSAIMYILVLKKYFNDVVNITVKMILHCDAKYIRSILQISRIPLNFLLTV